jgi:hypothetical protein
VGLLDDAGDDVPHPLAVLLEELLVVDLVEPLVERLAHDLSGDAGKVVGRYVLVVLHDPEVARVLVEDHAGVLVGPLAPLVGGEQGLFEHPLDGLEGDALVVLYLVQS